MPFDALLPVSPGGLDGRGFFGARYWRDIPQSPPIEITPPAVEPLSLLEVKAQIRATPFFIDDDDWLVGTLIAARMLVEADCNRAFVPRTLEMTFDQYPLERWIPLPRSPLISVISVSSFDLLTGAETVFDPSNYLVDTYSEPGRICLNPGKIWPVGVRWLQGGKIRWVAGYSGPVPARYLHAIKLMIGNWDDNRAAGGVMRGSPDVYPLAYDSLIGDRVSYFG